MQFLIVIDKKTIHKFHQYYMKQHPTCRTLPFAKSKIVKLFYKDGKPKLSKSGKQKTKKQSVNKKDYELSDCLYGCLSLNELLVIQNRMVLNGKKHNWEELGIWLAAQYGLTDLNISNCMMEFRIFSETKANKDNDNIAGGIKFLNDGFLVKSHFCIDDNYNIINPLLINCDYDKLNPRTEIRISVFDNKVKNVYEKIAIHIDNFKDV